MPARKKSRAPRPASRTAAARERTILLAVTGMSPAILTETVWALAKEKQPVIPDEVVVLTTTRGADDLRRLLLAPRSDWGGRHVWEALRAAVLGRHAASDLRLQLAEPRIIELPDTRTGVRRPADDLRTADDNEAAADFLLEEVRRHTENPDTRLVASIAGGRKTMGALLYGALTLLGRETDRLTHVLVNEPFDACRDFFFPAQPLKSVLAGHGAQAKGIDAKAAHIELADIPFVPLRNRFADLGQKPGSFRHLVQRYSTDLKADADRPVRVSFDVVGKVLRLDGTPIPMRPRAQILLRFLVEKGKLVNQEQAAGIFADWRASLDDESRQALGPTKIEDVDFRRELNHLKTSAAKCGCRWPVAPRSMDFTSFEIA